MFSNTKGITPLVATVLLVAFSVGLGALVMSWGEDYIAEKAEFVQGEQEIKSGCDAATISLIRVTGEPQICIGAPGIEVYLDNGPDMDLVNVHARIAGTDGVDVKEDILGAPLLKSSAARTTIPLTAPVGQILQVKLTPKIWTGSSVITCPERAIVIERLANC